MFVLPFFLKRFISPLQIQTLVKRSLIYSTLTLEVQHFHEAFNTPLNLTIKLLKSTFEYLICPIPENLSYYTSHCRILEEVNLYQTSSASTS